MWNDPSRSAAHSPQRVGRAALFRFWESGEKWIVFRCAL